MHDFSGLEKKTILVTGGCGFLGQHVCRMLRSYGAIVLANNRESLDLTTNTSVLCERMSNCDAVIHLAAHVSGIENNRLNPYNHIYNNGLINLNVVHAAFTLQKPIVAAGSVCSYPEKAELPFRELSLWDGKPELTNFAYGESKRHLLALLESFKQSAYPPSWAYLVSANLYGPGDNFEPAKSHVIPALVKKFHEHAHWHLYKNDTWTRPPLVEIWGSPKTSRDFLYVADAAAAYVKALLYVLEQPCRKLVCNIGSGVETQIHDVVKKLQTEYKVPDKEVIYKSDRPIGQSRRLLNIEIAKSLLDWNPTFSIEAGLERTVSYYEQLQGCGHDF